MDRKPENIDCGALVNSHSTNIMEPLVCVSTVIFLFKNKSWYLPFKLSDWNKKHLKKNINYS